MKPNLWCKPRWTHRLFPRLCAAGLLAALAGPCGAQTGGRAAAAPAGAATLTPAAATAATATAAVTPAPAAPASTFVSYSGSATALGTDRFLYDERHFVRFHNGRIAERVVLYLCRNGVPFARKHLLYVHALSPDFELVDVTRGLHEGVRSKPGGREIFYRESADDPEAAASLPDVSGLVADAGFDEFIRAHWGTLLAGEKRELDFVIPSRLDVLKFRVSHVEPAVVDGVPAEMFRLRLSGFLGLLLKSIDVYYGAADHRLIRYDGLSNLHDASGSIYKVHIVFPPASRAASDALALRKALQAPLARCP